MKKIGNLNPYALDYPVCVSAQQTWTTNMFYDIIIENKDVELIAAFTSIFETVPLKDAYEPCEDNYASDYLNKADVKERYM